MAPAGSAPSLSAGPVQTCRNDRERGLWAALMLLAQVPEDL